MFSSPSAAASLFLMVKVYHFAQIPSSNFLFFRLSDETFRFFSSPCCRFTHPLLHFSENFSILAFPFLQAAKERIAGLFNILRFVRRPPNRTVLARPSGAFGRTVQRKKEKSPNRYDSDFEPLVGGGGFEPPKSLTTDLQSAPFGHSGNLPYLIERKMELVDGLEPPTC